MVVTRMKASSDHFTDMQVEPIEAVSIAQKATQLSTQVTIIEIKWTAREMEFGSWTNVTWESWATRDEWPSSDVTLSKRATAEDDIEEEEEEEENWVWV
ncbi:keratin associated protein 9 1 [Echinococcus multilocularis]|uniref:Keratin associated protein 9 1 n=1 Tax=Echinococcus multilocularis TaxID=6211 RepID=A0A0S4MMT2_ECHMU|nr:keratin associated protein 9 1 [Echinococcus multilocularis]